MRGAAYTEGRDGRAIECTPDLEAPHNPDHSRHPSPCFFSTDALPTCARQDEPDRPRLDEEILVLRLEHSDGPSSRRGSGQSGDGEEKEGDTSSAAARMRWYKAKVRAGRGGGGRRGGEEKGKVG